MRRPRRCASPAAYPRCDHCHLPGAAPDRRCFYPYYAVALVLVLRAALQTFGAHHHARQVVSVEPPPPLLAHVEAAAFSPARASADNLGSGESVEGGDAHIEAVGAAI